MAKERVNIPTVEELGDWVTTKRAAEFMGVELPSVGAIIHDGRVKSVRIAGVFLVDRVSATEFGKRRAEQAQADAARRSRAEKLEKLLRLSDEKIAELLSQVEGETGSSDNGATEEVADKVE